jgi:hypothetical protein
MMTMTGIAGNPEWPVETASVPGRKPVAATVKA